MVCDIRINLNLWITLDGLLKSHLIQMDEGVAIARSAMTKTVAFLQKASFPDELTGLDGRLHVSTCWPGSVPKK